MKKGAYKGREQQTIPSVANSWNRWLRFNKMASRVQPIIFSKRDVLHNKPSPSALVLHKKISQYSESPTRLQSMPKKMTVHIANQVLKSLIAQGEKTTWS